MAAYYNEIDPYCVAWLRNLIAKGHIAPGDVDERSIADVKADDLKGYDQCHFFAGIGIWSAALRQAGWPDDRPVWTGSCPCQPFSAAGKRQGEADDRHLWPEFYRLIRQCRPVTIFGEQVASKDGLAWLDIVQSDLENADYASGAVDLCAAGVGAPHIRQRLFFMAKRGNQCGELFVGSKDISGRKTASRWPLPTFGAKPASDAENGSVCGFSELANADGRNAGAEGLQRSGQHGQQQEDGGTVRLAQPDEGQWRPGRTTPGCARGSQSEFAGSSVTGELGDAAINGIGTFDGQSRSSREPQEPLGGSSFLIVVGDTDDARPQERECDGYFQSEAMESPQGQAAERGSYLGELGHAPRDGWIEGRSEPARQQGRPDVAEPGPTNGFWAGCDWIPCTDGKARPVEAGTFPLAHGDTGRVGKLRAYGNAVNKEATAEFIAAAIKALAE